MRQLLSYLKQSFSTLYAVPRTDNVLFYLDNKESFTR